MDQLNNIVGNLLSLAQPAESNPEEIDIRQEIERCANFIETKARNQNVKLQTDFEKDLPKLRFNQSELRQLLLNVMMNGLQAMSEGGMLLIKACCLLEGAHDLVAGSERVLIQIEDKYPGIPANLRQKVFEPFFTTKAGGTGLGLAICNSIVKRYNDEIWIEQAGRGPTIEPADLPRRIYSESEVPEPTSMISGRISLAETAAQATAKAERQAIHKALSETGGNREKAAEFLGIGRKNLYRKLRQYGIE